MTKKLDGQIRKRIKELEQFGNSGVCPHDFEVTNIMAFQNRVVITNRCPYCGRRETLVASSKQGSAR